jgi:Na+:H+ antiporter, NhaA family
MITKLTKLFVEFLESEQVSGTILIVCTFISIAIANSDFGKVYSAFWHTNVGIEMGGIALKYSFEQWINDGLMAIFFLLIGLEIERELYIGELSDLKDATLPLLAALGGMSVPALIHFLFNRGTETQGGIGIPMATDIAFAIAMLALLGNKVPSALKVFVVALAIVDDLGAIIVIAVFYCGEFSPLYLVLVLGIFGTMLILNRLGVRGLHFYLIPGVVMWYCLLKSGVHGTLAGVLLAFAIPFRLGDEESPSYKLQHLLHKPVAFIIMPLFALANTGISLTGNWVEGLTTSNSLGILAGLLVGKPVGITVFSFLSVKLGLSQLPGEVSWKHVIGAGALGGIGFTMSIFITLLAFSSPEIIQTSKTAILLSSLLAGVTGFLILRR